MPQLGPIIIIDDDSDDIQVTTEAIKTNYPESIVQSFSKAESFYEYLLNKSHDKPCLVFLDLNMPGRNGWDVLNELKKNNDYRYIPIIMWTTSNSKHERIRSLDLGANCFITKPSLFHQISVVVYHAIELFCMEGSSNTVTHIS